MRRHLNDKLWLIILSVTLPFLAFHTQAAEELHENHHTKTAMGIHGMAIFSIENQFFASHMPLANSIHAHQVILSIQLPSKIQSALTEQKGEQVLLSIMPEPFDLHHLMDGTLTSFSASIYQGHFERGGKVIFPKVEVSVKKLLLSMPLIEQKNGRYYFLKSGETSGLVVHKIGSKPSFDQIFSVSFTDNPSLQVPLLEMNTVVIGNHIPATTTQLRQVLEDVAPIKLIQQKYLEQADFQ